jgi:hypothetical protein
MYPVITAVEEGAFQEIVKPPSCATRSGSEGVEGNPVGDA